MWALGIEKRAKYWFLRAVCYFFCATCRRGTCRRERTAVASAAVLTAAPPAAAVLTAELLWHQPPSLPPWGLLLHQVVNVLDVVVLLKFVQEFLYLGFGLWVKDFEVCGWDAGELTGDYFQALLLQEFLDCAK